MRLDLLRRRCIDHIVVICGDLVMQALRRVREKIPVLVDRAALDRNAVPYGGDRLVEPGRAIDDEELGVTQSALDEIVEDGTPSLGALATHALDRKHYLLAVPTDADDSRKLVRQVVRGERNDVFRTRQSSLDVHLPWLDEQWTSNCRNGTELWRRLTARGFRGSLRVVGEWATRRRRAERADAENLQRIPSARTIARLMTIGRDTLSKAETVTVAAIEAGMPTLVEAREIIAEFHMMIRRKTAADLTSWIGRARTSLVASFGNGVIKDEAAVRAAITLPWSNGQTEGQITRLKLVRRQMYGRGNIDLLQARLIGAE